MTIIPEAARRTLHVEWNEGARRLVARFRAQAARHVGDSDFENLISELREASPEFREWWELHEVATSGVGRKVLKHPKVGKLVFEHAVFRPEESPDLRLVLYTTVPVANTPKKLAELLADRS